MRLFSALLVRNEAAPDRYLKRVLERCLSFSDKVLVLDDRSKDWTVAKARKLGCEVRIRKELDARAWGNESTVRAELWDFALEYATEPDDWVLIADADMELHGDPRPLCESVEVNTWSFILYDLWSETAYRSDGFWQGHTVPRPWLFAVNRVPDGYVPHWPTRGLHCGHCPMDWPMIPAVAPFDTHYYLHLAYKTPQLRRKKAEQYLSKRHLLTEFEIAHAESILADP